MVLSTNDISTEGLVNRAYSNGFELNAGTEMVLQQQYKAGAAIANTTTETSLYTVANFVPAMSGNAAITATLPLPTIPNGCLSIGILYKGRIVGTIANTGTPTLRTRVVLRNTAGTIAYTLSDTTATAMTTVSTVDFEVNFDIMTAVTGVSGSLVGRVNHRYANTTVYAVGAAVAVDTTQQYTIDVLVTWGAASASNTLTPLWSVLEIE